MALNNGILYASYSVKGKLGKTLVAVDDAAVAAAWTQIYTTTPGYLADGTRLKWARYYVPSPGSSLYNTAGEIITTRGMINTGAAGGGAWNDSSADVTYQGQGALGDPGACAGNVIRLASNVVDGETLTIDAQVYEFTDDGALTTPSNIPVDISGGVTPTIVAPILTSTINLTNNQNIFAEKITVNEISLRKTKSGVDTTVCSTTMGGANNAIGANFYGGQAPISSLRRQSNSRVPTTQEVAIGNMHFVYDFQPKNPIVQMRVTATGLPLTHTCDVTTNGNRLMVHNTGGTNYATTNTVVVSVTD